MPYILIDVNGQKGPNKLGHDVIYGELKIKDEYSSPSFVPYKPDYVVDIGGKTAYKLMYGKEK